MVAILALEGESMSLFDYLNQNSGAITVIFTAFVAIATVVYAILTWKLVSETRMMREVQTEPKISAIIQPKDYWLNFIDLIIQNIGLGPAYNIKFEISPDFEDRNLKLSEIGFIKHGLRYLAPNQKIQFFLTSLTENYEEKVKNPFEIRIIYENSIHKSYSNIYSIDFSQFTGTSQLGEPPLYKISKNIEDIQKNIGYLSTGRNKLQVITYTKKEIDEEEEKIMETIMKRQRGQS